MHVQRKHCVEAAPLSLLAGDGKLPSTGSSLNCPTCHHCVLADDAKIQSMASDQAKTRAALDPLAAAQAKAEEKAQHTPAKTGAPVTDC